MIVEFYLGSKDRDGASIDGLNFAVKRLVRDAAKLFGGATYYEGIGIWQDPNGQWVEENVGIVRVLPNHEARDDWYKFADRVSRELNQTTVLYTINGEKFYA